MAQPSKLNWQVSFPLSNPAGNVTLRFATGQRGGNPAFLWETIVSSTRAELPGMPEEFAQWLEAAHSVTHDWFFKLIAGELERRFSSE
jgi:uncharacterized protein (TIGR04255 family)